MSTDRELLFGFLALRNECLTRQELLAGIREWSDSGSPSLAAVLRRREAIPADECELLQRLVDLFVQRHNHDLQACL